MDKERLQDELHTFKDRIFLQQKLSPTLKIYVLLVLCYLLSIILFVVSLSRVSMVSSQLNELHNELKQNHSSNNLKLFPCGPETPEWTYFSGKCYYFSLRKTSWQKAKVLCEEEHSHLAVISSRAKQNFVMYRTRNERFWIGLSDQNHEGEWKWIDGTDYTTTFTFWKEGEPNDSGLNEDCAHIWIYGEWNDVHCTYECYYICEKPAPP
uniref:C-type lectin domain-containing protein n=1 Tax=Pelusios castaneus TaxID=367368 RepID=A0A8C8SET3_9SAUR